MDQAAEGALTGADRILPNDRATIPGALGMDEQRYTQSVLLPDAQYPRVRQRGEDRGCNYLTCRR